MKRLPITSIIIVNYNGKKYLKDCFSSILKQTYPQDKIEIIMVDNNSTDDSIALVTKSYPSIKVIKNGDNNYCKANNLGFKKSKGELIIFLNNDTIVKKDWLINLTKVALTHPEAGAVGSKILLEDSRINSTGHREQPHYYYADEGFKENDMKQYDSKKEVESVCGCSVMYKKSCLEDIGGFDEDFIMYCEDVDMSIRCKKKGWKLFFAPQSVVIHKYNGSGNLELQEKFVERNRLLLIAKHYPKALPEELVTLQYYLKKENLFDIASLIIKKLVKHHGHDLFLEMFPSLMVAFKKYEFLKKDYLVKSFEAERAEFRDAKIRLRHNINVKEKELEVSKRFIEKKEKEKEILIKEKEEEKKELLKRMEETYLRLLKQQEAHYKETIRQLNEQYQLKKDELNRVYSSKTHQLVTSNIWALTNILKKRRKDAK